MSAPQPPSCPFSNCVYAALGGLNATGYPYPLALPIPLPLNLSIAEVGTTLQDCFVTNNCPQDSSMSTFNMALMLSFLAINITANIENITTCATEMDINPFVPLCTNNSYPNMTALLDDFRNPAQDRQIMKNLCKDLKCIIVSYAKHTSCSPDVVKFYTQYLKIAAAPVLFVYLKNVEGKSFPFDVAWFPCRCKWYFDFS